MNHKKCQIRNVHKVMMQYGEQLKITEASELCAILQRIFRPEEICCLTSKVTLNVFQNF